MPLRWQLFKDAAAAWSRRDPPRLGAALAYYTALSLAPLIVAVVAICGLVLGDDVVRNRIYWQIQPLVGTHAARRCEDAAEGRP